jgi:hypothetical protein
MMDSCTQVGNLSYPSAKLDPAVLGRIGGGSDLVLYVWLCLSVNGCSTFGKSGTLTLLFYCCVLFAPAVSLPDGSTQHFNLRQQAYKVTHEHSTRDGSGGGGRGSRRTSEAEKDPHPQDSAGGAGGKKVKQQTSPSTNSAGGSGSSKAAAAALLAKDRKPTADARADGTAKPPRRAAADRAAAVAVAVSMGGNGGLHGGREEEKSSRRPVPTPKGSAGAFAASGGARRGGGDAVGVEPARKLPPLNMSHVSKKDREAARMLLTFSTPTAQEVRAGSNVIPTMRLLRLFFMASRLLPLLCACTHSFISMLCRAGACDCSACISLLTDSGVGKGLSCD